MKQEQCASLQAQLDADAHLDDGQVVRKFNPPALIWISADGGADHNTQHLKVRLSLLALSRCLGVPKLSALRGCPNQSYTLTAERAMSLLQLGIIHLAIERRSMPEESEAAVANCSSMAISLSLAVASAARSG